jgi:ATP-binding cassette subfamily C protein CydC
MTRDVDLLDNLYIRLLVPIGAATLVLASIAVLSATFSPAFLFPIGALAVVALILVPGFMFFAGRTLAPRLVSGQERVRLAILDLIEGLDDWILHKPAWTGQREKVLGEDRLRVRDQVRIQRIGAGARALVVVTIGLATWSFVGLAAALSPQGSPALEGPWFVALTLLILGTGEALLGLPGAWIELPGTAAAARRMTDLGEVPPDPAFPPGPAAVSGTGAPDLRLDQISFSYSDEERILEDITLTLAPGDHLALVGPSGGGKTTLVRLMTRLEDPTTGRLVLGGQDLKDWDEPSVRQMISCAMQDPWIFRDTLAENLRLGDPEASDAGLWQVLDLVGLGDQVRAWPEGLETAVEEGGQSLSGGQRRRLAVARALLRKAPITVLDEPTEGLEAEAALELVEAIRRELAGKTLVWVTHRRQGLDRFPRVCHLEGGHLTTRP